MMLAPMLESSMTVPSKHKLVDGTLGLPPPEPLSGDDWPIAYTLVGDDTYQGRFQLQTVKGQKSCRECIWDFDWKSPMSPYYYALDTSERSYHCLELCQWQLLGDSYFRKNASHQGKMQRRYLIDYINSEAGMIAWQNFDNFSKVGGELYIVKLLFLILSIKWQ